MLEQTLWTAVVTPFTESDNQVDYNSLEKVVRMQDDAGNGIILLGSTGESLLLSSAEAKQIVEFVLALKLKRKVMVGVPSYNIEQALNWIETCNEYDLAGYLLTTPIYTKPGVKGQTAWYEKLLNKAKHPAMLYNIPGRAAGRLHADTVKNLANHEKFLAIKDSSGGLEMLVEFMQAAPKVKIYCGDDYLLPAMAAEGAVGLISVASNAWPTATRKYVTKALAGDKFIDKTWWEAVKALFSASNPIPIKALMKHLKIIASDSLRLPLLRDDLASLDGVIKANESIMIWEKNND